MGIAGSFSDQYSESKGSGQASGLGSNTGQQSGTWKPNAAVSGIYGQLAGMLGNMAGVSQGYFPGQGYVAPSAATQVGVNMGMSALPNYQNAANSYNSAAGLTPAAAAQQIGVNNTALGNYGYLSNAADVANNPYVQGQLAANKQQVNQAFNESWLPAINQGAQTVNALGSSRQGLAQAQGIERAAQQLANTNANTMLTAYGQGLGAQQSALGQAGSLNSNLLNPSASLAQGATWQQQAGDTLHQGAQNALGYGQTVEGYQQSALNDAMNRYNWQYTEPYQRISNAGSVLNSIFQPTGTTLGSNTGLTSQQQSNADTSKGWGVGSKLSGGMGMM